MLNAFLKMYKDRQNTPHLMYLYITIMMLMHDVMQAGMLCVVREHTFVCRH